MPENALEMGQLLRSELSQIKSPRLASVRGRGLMNAIVIKQHGGVAAWDVCLRLRDNGLLVWKGGKCCNQICLHVLCAQTKPTHHDTIRLAPPLIINRDQVLEAAAIIRKTIESFD